GLHKPPDAYRYTRSAWRRPPAGHEHEHGLEHGCGAITSVTQKCQDIGDTFRPRRRVGGRDAVAVEQGVADEAARGICAAGPGAESMHGEAVSPIRDKPAERLQVGQSLPRGGGRWAARSVAA